MSGRGALASLEGKVAVVTGGSQGLGEAIAREFVARGLKGLIISGRNAERGAAVARDLEAQGCRTEFVTADLASAEDTATIMAACDRLFGRVDILVNAAGDTDRGTIFDTSLELYDRMMAVNLRAPFFLIQDAAKIMRREKIEGSIVNIQSMSAHGGQPFISRLLGIEGWACDADQECRVQPDAVAHSRERPQYRLDGDAGRRCHHPQISWRAGRMAREGRCRAALRPPARPQGGGASRGLSRVG